MCKYCRSELSMSALESRCGKITMRFTGGTYSNPIAKTTDTPTLFLHFILSFQITVCGRIKTRRCDTRLKAALDTSKSVLFMHVPAIVLSQIRWYGLQVRFPMTKAEP